MPLQRLLTPAPAELAEATTWQTILDSQTTPSAHRKSLTPNETVQFTCSDNYSRPYPSPITADGSVTCYPLISICGNPGTPPTPRPCHGQVSLLFPMGRRQAEQMPPQHYRHLL